MYMLTKLTLTHLLLENLQHGAECLLDQLACVPHLVHACLNNIMLFQNIGQDTAENSK